jgi:hypothetical protein
MAAPSADPWPPFLPDPALLGADGEERREGGRQHLSEAVLQILRHISHPQLSELADWACNEVGNLHASQVSHLRHGKLKMLGVKCVDALGRINQAAWVFHRQPALLERMGTAPLTPRIEAILRRYDPLVHPGREEPLGAADYMALYLGYLQLPVEAPLQLSEEQSAALAARIGVWLDGQLTEQGLSFREAARRLRLAWPGEASGAERLIRVIGGMEDYTPRQLSEEWERIAVASAAVLELEADARTLAERLLSEGQTPQARKPQQPQQGTRTVRKRKQP